MEDEVLNSSTLPQISEIFSKPYAERTEQENNLLAKILMNNEYFKHFTVDPGERSCVIHALLKNLKYSYFPKGTVVVSQGDADENFRIVLRGQAFIYNVKPKEDFDKEIEDLPDSKREKIRDFRRYIEAQEYQKRLRRWVYFKDCRDRELYDQAKEATHILDEVTNAIFHMDSITTQSSVKEDNLRHEEKLLILNHSDTGCEYIRDGVPLYYKTKKVKDGDFMGIVSLLTGMTQLNTVIASESLHVISIHQTDFYALFKSRIDCLAEKKNFLWSMFPDLLSGLIVRLCLMVEEKIFTNRDTVYEEGNEADAIYILKSGGIELYTYAEVDKKIQQETFTSVSEKPKKTFNHKQRLVIGEIGPHAIFGEEVITRTTRNYNAFCTKSPTVVYQIKKDIYQQVVEKYFPMISEYYKLVVNTKTKWRQDRKEKGAEINNQLNEFIIKKRNKSQTVMKAIHVLNPHKGSLLEVLSPNPGSNHEVQTARVIDYEERNSRNTKSKIEIVTRDTTQRNRLRTSIQQESLNFILPFRKSKLSQLDVGHNSKTLASPKNSMTKTQIKLHKRSHTKNSATLLSAGLSPTDQPQHLITHVKAPPPRTPIKSPTLLISSPQSSIAQRDSPLQVVLSLPMQNMIDSIQDSSRSPRTHKRASSPESPELLGFDSWDIKTFRRSPNSRRDSVKSNIQDEIEEMRSAGLSPASARFYKRVTAFNLPANLRKDHSPTTHQATPIEVKPLLKKQTNDDIKCSDPKPRVISRKVSANLDLISQSKMSSGDRPFTVAPNTARLTPTSPNIQSPINLKKVFLFNRGQEDPKAVVFGSEAIDVAKFKWSSKPGTPRNRLL